MCLKCRKPGLDSWVGKTPGEWNGYPLQHSCLDNSTDRSYSPWDHRVGHTWVMNTFTFFISLFTWRVVILNGNKRLGSFECDVLNKWKVLLMDCHHSSFCFSNQGENLRYFHSVMQFTLLLAFVEIINLGWTLKGRGQAMQYPRKRKKVFPMKILAAKLCFSETD